MHACIFCMLWEKSQIFMPAAIQGFLVHYQFLSKMNNNTNWSHAADCVCVITYPLTDVVFM